MLGVLMPRTRAEVEEMLLTKRVQRERKYKKTQNTCGHQTCAKAYKYAQICARMCARIKHILTLGTL